VKPKRILLVEDEALARRTLGRALEAAGYEVVALADGAEALRRLEDERFDLVVTDLVMEGQDGVQVLRQAKEADPDTCVMMMSGYCDVNSAIDALRLGAEEYLAKPFDYEEFLLRVQRCVEKRELRHRLKLYEDLLPLCGGCRRIRDDTRGEPGSVRWVALEEYLLRNPGAKALHGPCPECAREL